MVTWQSLQAAKNRRHHKQKTVRKHIFILILVFLSLVLSVALGGVVTGQDSCRQEVVVLHGDTLWTLASEYLPKGRDIRDYVEEIIIINRLASPVIYPGQVLRLP